MAKHCPRTNGYALYLDCLECDNKICMNPKQNRKWGHSNVAEVSKMEQPKLKLRQRVFVVFHAYRLNGKKNIVIKGMVTGILLKTYCGVEHVQYKITLLECMNNKQFDMDSIVENVYCLDTVVNPLFVPKDYKPVFTEKEKCIRWLKEL